MDRGIRGMPLKMSNMTAWVSESKRRYAYDSIFSSSSNSPECIGNSKPHLSTLPPELVRLIFQHTGYVEAVCLALTCKALYGFHLALRIEDSPRSHLVGSQYLADYYNNHLDYNVALRRHLRGWMGPKLVYNPYVGKFTTYKRVAELHKVALEDTPLLQSLMGYFGKEKKSFKGRERVLHERRVEAVEETFSDWRTGRHPTSVRMYNSALRLSD